MSALRNGGQTRPARDAWRRRLYSLRARGQALRWNRYEFALGLLAGPSLDRLAPLPGVVNPILTRHDIDDVPAGFLADPFLLQRPEGWYLFFEVWNEARAIGEIGCAFSHDLTAWRYRGVVLTRPEHLSYPQVFTWKDQIYMLPETAAAGVLRLFRARRFPTEWEALDPVIKRPLVDASLLEHDGRWWLFAETSPGMTNSRLELFMAPTPLGPWSPHPANPLIDHNALIARPGGRIFVDSRRQDGLGILRFAQECLPDYGTAVRVFKIEDLTPQRYHERPLDGGWKGGGREGRQSGAGRLLGPGRWGWNACGMHHIDLHRAEPWGLVAAVDGR